MNNTPEDVVKEARAHLDDPALTNIVRYETRKIIASLCDEVERLRERFSVTCGNCGERYLGPRDDSLHGYNVCAMSRCED